MSAMISVEAFLHATLLENQSQLGVEIRAGRGIGNRPPSYIAVIADSEEPRAAGLYMVDCRIVTVASIDDAGELQASALRHIWLSRFFGPDCPVRKVQMPELRIYNISITRAIPSQRKERSQAEFLFLRVAAQVS